MTFGPTSPASWGGTAGAIVAAGSGITIDRTEYPSGTIFGLGGSPSAMVLPAAIGSGWSCQMLVTAAQAHTIVTAPATDFFFGSVIVNDVGDSSAATADGYATAANSNKITASTTAGFGRIGDIITLTDFAAGKWRVNGFAGSAADPATPFSNV